MSEFGPALEKTLRHEGGYFENPKTGEVANFGITVWFLRSSGWLHGSGPASDDEASYVFDLSRETASSIYEQYFWNAHNFSKINNQALAERAFDLTVNMGAGGLNHGQVIAGGVTLLQGAVNKLSVSAIVVDGHLGPISLARINGIDPVRLLATYKSGAKRHYREIVARNPKLSDQLTGWLKRLDS